MPVQRREQDPAEHAAFMEYFKRTKSHPNFVGYDAFKGRHASRNEDMRPFACQHCEGRFALFNDLRRHHIDKHPARPMPEHPSDIAF